MSKSIRQHWVPQFYLREFSVAEPENKKEKQVWIFHREEGEPTLSNVKKIAAKRHLYTPLSPDGTRDWKSDDELTSLEGLISQIWPRVANGYVDLSNDAIRKGISLFVATLILRHPKNIPIIKKMHESMVNIFDKLPKDSNGLPVGRIEINGDEQEVDNSDWWKYKNATEYDHRMAFNDSIKGNATYVAKILMEKRWSIVVSDDPIFITSDSPVVSENSNKPIFGLGTNGTVISFPLSPTRVLYMDDLHDERASQYYPASELGAIAFNQIQWKHTYRFMITCRHPVKVLSEIIELSEKLKIEHA